MSKGHQVITTHSHDDDDDDDDDDNDGQPAQRPEPKPEYLPHKDLFIAMGTTFSVRFHKSQIQFVDTLLLLPVGY